MKRVVASSSLRAFLFLLWSSAAWAQATAELNGRVTDESGAVLPGVTVTATQTDTGLTRTVVTDDTGTYSMPNLAPGPYRLEVSLQGFRTYVQTGIVLQVGAAPTVNVSLAVGNLEETVSVEAGGAARRRPQRRHQQRGRERTHRRAAAAGTAGHGSRSCLPARRSRPRPPARARCREASVLRWPAACPSAWPTCSTARRTTIPQNNLNLPLPFPDALQEFSVATSGLSAQNGMHSGASVSAVTKSGTNALHGNAFELLRDRHFNATSRFSEVLADGVAQR